MFQTVCPSIIRGSKLHIQRQAFVRPLLLPAASLVGMFHPDQASSRTRVRSFGTAESINMKRELFKQDCLLWVSSLVCLLAWSVSWLAI